MDLEYEIEFVCFIGRRVNLMPYIKDIRMSFSTFPSFYVDKSLCNNTCQKIESAEIVTMKQPMRVKKLVELTNYLPETEVLTVRCHISLMRNRKIYVCTYTERKLKIYQYLDNYFLYFDVSLFSISNLMLV